MSSSNKHTARPNYKLREIILPGKSEPEKGKFRAIVTDRGSYGTEKVIEEMLDYSSLRLSPYMVESVVNGVMESMIKHTLSDGVTRRFGDYFAVRLEVKGTFDEKDAAFDPKKNSVKVVLMPLKRFRKAVDTDRPQNTMKPPRALMKEIRGENSPMDCIRFGENIVITGRDLTVVDMKNQVCTWMIDKKGRKKSDCWCISDMIEHSPTRIVVPFPKVFKKEDFHANARYRVMYFEFLTDSGKKGGPYRLIKYKHEVKVLLDPNVGT